MLIQYDDDGNVDNDDDHDDDVDTLLLLDPAVSLLYRVLVSGGGRQRS